jgi:putative Mg2+ transporter-C (MgtC) family protein
VTELEVVLRVLAAAAVGFLIGVERSRRIRFVGARTFALIAAAGAMAGVVAMRLHSEDARVISTVLQGVLMGVGFVGAGVIMHPACGRSIHGVTTAAAVWVSALCGFAAGLGEWILMAVGAVLTFGVLMAPEPFAARSQASGDRDEPPCG